MDKNKDLILFLAAKEEVMENLLALRFRLANSVNQGMVDHDDAYSNELSTLLDDAGETHSWTGLMQIISRGKILEADIDTWLAMHGVTTIGLEWPSGSS